MEKGARLELRENQNQPAHRASGERLAKIFCGSIIEPEVWPRFSPVFLLRIWSPLLKGDHLVERVETGIGHQAKKLRPIGFEGFLRFRKGRQTLVVL